jgi:sulfhydrogenase subunit beta (sulfur reductase)
MTNSEDRHFHVTVRDLEALFDELHVDGFQIVGPKIKDQVITLDVLDKFTDIPRGHENDQEAGHYRLRNIDDGSFFKYTVGMDSVKKFLHPSRRKVFSQQTDYKTEETTHQKFAFFSLRACDVKSIEVLDKVFLQSSFVNRDYKKRREDLFILTASCLQPASVCFCTSMGYGPEAEKGFDINLTEIYGKEHYFLANYGSEKGRLLLENLGLQESSKAELEEKLCAMKESRASFSKSLNTKGLPEILQKEKTHPQWDKVADRCLSCANCTMVCPTCFCSTIEDTVDITGEHAERWLTWDSCFNADFSYIHGGTVRSTTKGRYRQWMTHKLSTWHDQFDMSGCVGCGRCIAWCPVGIDLREEVKAIRGEEE